MTVSISGDVIVLGGHCAVEDAEPLLQALCEASHPQVDLRTATHLHTAVVQLLLAARPTIVAPPADRFLRVFALATLIENKEGVSATL